MKNLVFVLFVIASFGVSTISAQCSSSKKHHKEVKSYSQHKDIIDIAVESDVHTTLVAAVKAAGLVSTLQGDGPFTVFAPTNLAFDRLPEGTVASLLEPANKSKLVDVLTYHVIASEVTAESLVAAIKASGGTFTISTVQGDQLEASMKGNHVILTDTQGRISKITATDLKGSNGVIHVIDTVVLPK